MLKNYLKIALRNIVRHKIYSFINIAGLAIGMACTILILLWIQDELSYDRFHNNYHQIHRVAKKQLRTNETELSALTPPPLAPGLKQDFPGINKSTRFGNWGRCLVKYDLNSFDEKRYEFVDPDFFDMFSFPFLKGNPKTAFSDLHAVILTEKMAEKYFGEEDPLGKYLTINNKFDVNDH